MRIIIICINPNIPKVLRGVKQAFVVDLCLVWSRYFFESQNLPLLRTGKCPKIAQNVDTPGGANFLWGHC